MKVLKILLVHEYYRSSSPSGEDKVFERELKLLGENRVDVETLIFKNDDIGTPQGPSVLQTAMFTPWSPLGKKLVREAIESFRPDLVHFHNTFPVISQSAIVQAQEMGVATVQTFHNFRSFCAQAMLMRADGVCEKCLGHYPWPALKNRCYRGSLAATLPLCLNIALHRWLGTWQKSVDRFIVLSDFNREKFIEAGFPADKIMVKPNFFTTSFANVPEKSLGEWVFIGRLGTEKGVRFIPEVWRRLGDKAPVLHMLGDGPEREALQERIDSLELNDKIIMHGHCTSKQVNDILAKASLLVFPSICYEGFPLVIGEAYAAGVPVAASKIGTPAFIVRDRVTGIHFQPGDVDDMVRQLTFLRENPEMLQAMSANARKEYEDNYTSEINFEIIMRIYQEALSENRRSQN